MGGRIGCPEAPPLSPITLGLYPSKSPGLSMAAREDTNHIHGYSRVSYLPCVLLDYSFKYILFSPWWEVMYKIIANKWHSKLENMYKIKDKMNSKLIHPCIGSYKSIVFLDIRSYQIRPQPEDIGLPFLSLECMRWPRQRWMTRKISVWGQPVTQGTVIGSKIRSGSDPIKK
jgi:hypothetical protein